MFPEQETLYFGRDHVRSKDLTVFLIQNSQNRDGEAIQIKPDESIHGSMARNSFAGIERPTDEELDNIREKCERRAKAAKIGKLKFDWR